VDSAKLIKVHVFIAKIRIFYWTLFILFEFLRLKTSILEVSNVFLISFLVISVLIFIDFAFALKEFYNNFIIVRITRSIMAMYASMGIICGMNRGYFASFSMFLFVTLVLQVMFFTNISRFRNKIVLFLLIYMPMSIASYVRIQQMDNLEFTIQTIVFNVILFSSMIIFLTIISHIFAESSLEKKRLNTELIKMRKYDNAGMKKAEMDLENAYERLSRENSEMLIENLIQHYISSSLEISNLMKLILESLSEALVVNLCSIILKGEDEKVYQYDSRSMCDSVNIEHFNSCIEDGSLIEQFKEYKEPFVDNFVEINEYYFLKDAQIKSLLIYPLMYENECLGMLVIGKDMTDYFLDNMAFFERVSLQFSIALTNARTYSQMEDMAMKDGLTGIYNRTFMIHKINEYVSSVVLNRSSLAIMMFDIDKFKDVNDEYGHLFGDEVIRVCANIAKENAEKHDGFAARYGGEEFVIVLKEDSLEELQDIASRLHNQIKQTKIEYRGSSLYINVSIGVAAYPTTCGNPAELIDRADKAMYYSKKLGRNRITFDDNNVLKN
jgi:diguanylate cyclase (GGDEF)-like protein